jgi:hypothetical protein
LEKGAIEATQQTLFGCHDPGDGLGDHALGIDLDPGRFDLPDVVVGRLIRRRDRQ